jgi:hypothetical protein
MPSGPALDTARIGRAPSKWSQRLASSASSLGGAGLPGSRMAQKGFHTPIAVVSMVPPCVLCYSVDTMRRRGTTKRETINATRINRGQPPGRTTALGRI